MCHLLLLLPILALPVFWLWPLELAAPVYAVIATISLLIYGFTIKAMRLPVRTGKEEMLHAMGHVLEMPDADAIWVRVHDERWLARGPRAGLHAGDRVRVVGMDGMTLLVVPDPEP